MKILFIGNSFTFYGAMPGFLRRIAYGEGRNIVVDSVTFGGYRLSRHADMSIEDGRYTDEILHSNDWDYVVLQGQSSEPALERESFLKAAKDMSDKIKAIGAMPVFYQTWSYYDGSEKLHSSGLSYDELYRALKDGYTAAAEQNGGILVPVGDMFRTYNKPHGDLDFICSDDYHPTQLGSYLSAVCFYRSLFEVIGAEHWHHPNISKEDAELVWEITKDIKCKI